MRRPPPFTQLPRYPVTGGTVLLAIGVSIAYWSKVDVSALFTDAMIRRGEIWRLLTSTLPHANILHLLFNVMWVWSFGTIIEEVYGHATTAMFFVLLAIASSAAEFAFLDGGIGLSGVGYGLFGMLLVLGKRDRRFAEAMDRNTIYLFIGWFVFCIFTTVTYMMPVANIAHGVGAISGMTLGWTLSQTGGQRIAGAVGMAVITVGFVGLAIFARPYINFSSEAGKQEAYEGWRALDERRYADAVRWLKDATRMEPGDAGNWFNLGIAYDRLGKSELALHAYTLASQLAPDKQEYKDAVAFEYFKWGG